MVRSQSGVLAVQWLQLWGERVHSCLSPLVVPCLEDVIHCFSVPSLGVKTDATPGRINRALPAQGNFGGSWQGFGQFLAPSVTSESQNKLPGINTFIQREGVFYGLSPSDPVRDCHTQSSESLSGVMANEIDTGSFLNQGPLCSPMWGFEAMDVLGNFNDCSARCNTPKPGGPKTHNFTLSPQPSTLSLARPPRPVLRVVRNAPRLHAHRCRGRSFPFPLA